jgi:MoaA/NifB/PqqE/SkfB family radical SAM enzyme
LFFIEFVPVDGNANLAPSDEERELLMEEIADLREKHPEMLFMSFPGDEKSTGGCLAAGRGFFHINYHGGAEPCPASPYSDINVRDATILEVLDSGFFKSLREDGILTEDHDGGCVLFEHKKEVESLLNH